MEFLLERRKLYTESSWEALYQQNPFIVGGGIFPIEKLTTWPILDRTKILKIVRYLGQGGHRIRRRCVHCRRAHPHAQGQQVRDRARGSRSVVGT